MTVNCFRKSKIPQSRMDLDKEEKKVVDAVKQKKHQSDGLTEPWCPSLRPVQSRDRSSIIEQCLAKRKNNSSCVPEPLEHPNSWEIGGQSVASLNGT